MIDMFQNDTIVAISTPSGTGGLHVIRISGDSAIKYASEIFIGKNNLESQQTHTISYGKIIDNDREIDEVLVSLFKAPRSYTGEDVVEISCHGNYFIATQILEVLLRKARLAGPGEFTQRAFLNNRIDLTQAEAVGDLLEAKTKLSQSTALQQMKGRLFSHINSLLKKLTEYRTLLELEIDFSEQGLDSLDVEKLEKEISLFVSELEDLAESGREGIILREGLKVALVGAPNVGKSSIFNAFLETERAIVTPIPGTTRDYLEEAISLNGYLVRLFDTAGLRETEDQVEQIGIKRSNIIISESDIILYITDNDKLSNDYDELLRIVDKDKVLKIYNKIDLLPDNQLAEIINNNFIPCSTVTENGLVELKKSLLKDFLITREELTEGILTNSRQISAVNRAISSVNKALSSLNDAMGYEFTAFDLKEASEALEEIIGKITNEDILGNIFSNFCVGK